LKLINPLPIIKGLDKIPNAPSEIQEGAFLILHA